MSVIVYQFQTVKCIQMMSLTFGLFTQVSGSGPLGPLVVLCKCQMLLSVDITVEFSGLNTDGSFTTALSNSYLSPLEKNPIAASFVII